MAKKLILFTSGFPFGSSEPFLETEIDFLSNAFDEVIVVCPNNVNSAPRKLPANCIVKNYSDELNKWDKLLSFFGIFTMLFWKELIVIVFTYKKRVNLGILKTMLISRYKGRRIMQFCKDSTKEDEEKSNFVFYSYWCDDAAIGLAMFHRKNQNYKCFSRAHGWDVYFEVSAFNYLPYRPFVVKNLSKLFPISDKGKSYISDVWKIKEYSKIQVSRLGVKNQYFDLKNFPVFTIVSCSNVISLKRIHLIIDALSQVETEQIQWFHFGDGPLLEDLKTYAKEKLPMNITHEFKGRWNNQELMDWYRQHQPDVFINVSSSEGIPVSIMEAMSFGIPAIATNVGGTAELVNDKNGVLLQANPIISDIKKAILFFINLSKSTQIELSEEAKSKWRNEYDAEKNYTTFVSRI
jgi:glycosyltransferase involved in cell wall biosynthesis